MCKVKPQAQCQVDHEANILWSTVGYDVQRKFVRQVLNSSSSVKVDP